MINILTFIKVFKSYINDNLLLDNNIKLFFIINTSLLNFIWKYKINLVMNGEEKKTKRSRFKYSC